MDKESPGFGGMSNLGLRFRLWGLGPPGSQIHAAGARNSARVRFELLGPIGGASGFRV